MALIDKASLLMVPSTYEAGTLYNVLPSGNRAPDSTDQNSGYDQTRADFDFDRGSNAAATRVNADGLIEKYRENKLLQSNQFDTTWLSDRMVLTSGQTDKDGGTSAWKITPNTDNNTHRIRQVVSVSGVQTYSIYAKAAGYDWLFLYINGSFAYFNLSEGTIGNTGSIIDSNITASANGYYRCSITYSNSVTNAEVYVADDNGSYVFVGNGTNGIYIQNAQLETGLVATNYLDSGATTAKAGVLIDLPRINYDANGENGALLLEPQRTNDIPHSEYLNAVTKSNVTITTNAATSPEGNKNAHNVVANATNSDHLFFQSSMGGSTNANTQTIYAKANGYDWIHIRFDLPTRRAFFNVANGTLGTADSGVVHTIEDAGNGWYRCSATMTTTSYVNAVVGLASDDATANFLGDGTSGVLMYGWQSEEASYPTSYIPNHGTSGGVTRAADSITSGTITAPLSGGYTAFIEFETQSTSVYNQIQFRETAANYVFRVGNQINVGAGSTIQTNTTGMNKFALQVSSGGAYELFKNGSSVATGTGITHDIELIKTDLAGQGVKQIAVFNEALTDAECISLTS